MTSPICSPASPDPHRMDDKWNDCLRPAVPWLPLLAGLILGVWKRKALTPTPDCQSLCEARIKKKKICHVRFLPQRNEVCNKISPPDTGDHGGSTVSKCRAVCSTLIHADGSFCLPLCGFCGLTEEKDLAPALFVCSTCVSQCSARALYHLADAASKSGNNDFGR